MLSDRELFLIKEWQVLGCQILDCISEEDFKILFRNVLAVRRVEWVKQRKVIAQ